MLSWKDLIESRFHDLHSSTENKVMPLAEAVRTFVQPKMKINPCGLLSRPYAAVYELCRQFQGTHPQFEYICSSLTFSMLPMVHLKLLRKAITAYAGYSYPTPGPSPVIVRALERKELEIESWSLLTISERLLAGAMGVPFITTRSLIGSSLGAEVPHAFKEIEDPFAEGGVTGILKAYNPDISLVHTWASDPAGNTICFPPLAENVYGPLAARNGVIVTTEHIVDTDFIRRYAHIGRIPAEKVLSVSHAPYGSHPYGHYSRNVPELTPYGNDYDFFKEHRKAQLDEEEYQKWVDEWVLNIANQDEYVEKLGVERRKKLHFVATQESWKPEFENFCKDYDHREPANPIERMIILASREIAQKVPAQGYKTVLCGVGQAALASILAWHGMHDRGYEFAIMAELGIYNFDPRPADSYVFNYRNIPTATILADIFEVLGLHTGGDTNRCLGLIGAAQVDQWGNVNSVRVDGKFLVGSGGANDIATAARETIVVSQQSNGHFVSAVEHITCPGKKIRCVVTTKARFEKIDGDELVLTGYMAEPNADEEESIRRIKELVDWDLRISNHIERIDMPGDEELMLLRAYDPERFFIGKLAK
jgi:acyl CoA:acetate/3-ketoacid CoA transferase alpha subunit